jgi:uncharacterized membrane protein YccF (DUF307 family)
LRKAGTKQTTRRKKAVRVIKKAWTVKDFISNVIWFLLGGLWLGILFVFLGLLLCLSVVGLPQGRECFRMARLYMFPYGKRVDLHMATHPVANVIWAILIGWVLALIIFTAGIALCLTVIGFFRGLQAFKLAKTALFPFGAEIIYRT